MIHNYDIAIIGGGLAGLALSIQCAKAGYDTVLFEKEKYPFHKVCGEYISLESWDFLEEIGVPLSEMNLPVIRKLIVSAPNGKILRQALPFGGFGISRFTLDAMLARLARLNGVTVLEHCKVEDVIFENFKFNIQTASADVRSEIVCGCFGKRSNLDLKWKRKFAGKKPNKLNNYIGVKYHVKIHWPEDTIALHNFKNGYCGISKIENETFCLCYLTTAANLENCSNSIKRMENEILGINPHLKNIFSESERVFNTPVVISQISFEKKTQLEDHMLMIGDAAGMITPLCGNGMSMALHGSKIAFEMIDRFIKKNIERADMEKLYGQQWNRVFAKRLRIGRFIQYFFGDPFLSNVFISAVKPFPRLVDSLIRSTHGKPF